MYNEIAYQCIYPIGEETELNRARKMYKYWVEAMGRALCPDLIPDLIPRIEFADNDKYKLYYLMRFGFCHGVEAFRITDNETEETIYIFTCLQLMKWVGEIPEEEKIKEEKNLFILFR